MLLLLMVPFALATLVASAPSAAVVNTLTAAEANSAAAASTPTAAIADTPSAAVVNTLTAAVANSAAAANTLTAAIADSTPTVLSTDAAVPVPGINAGAISLPSGDTRVFYQDFSNHSIVSVAVTNAFNTGVFESEAIAVPVGVVRPNSPIAVSAVVAATGDDWDQIRIAFFSPENVLTEYVRVPGGVFEGDCATCVTNEGFVGVPGSQVLYTITTSDIIRIGFVDAGEPNTISEAVNSGSGWSLAPLTS